MTRLEKGRRRGEEEEKAQSEKREAVAAFRGRERERIIAASGRPGLRSRALIGCFEEDETSGRTARAVFPFPRHEGSPEYGVLSTR